MVLWRVSEISWIESSDLPSPTSRISIGEAQSRVADLSTRAYYPIGDPKGAQPLPLPIGILSLNMQTSHYS